MTKTFERNVCRKRKSLHVFEEDKQGYHTIEVFDPLASVISYLRDQRWIEAHAGNDPQRISGILAAIEVCNARA